MRDFYNAEVYATLFSKSLVCFVFLFLYWNSGKRKDWSDANPAAKFFMGSAARRATTFGVFILFQLFQGTIDLERRSRVTPPDWRRCTYKTGFSVEFPDEPIPKTKVAGDVEEVQRVATWHRSGFTYVTTRIPAGIAVGPELLKGVVDDGISRMTSQGGRLMESRLTTRFGCPARESRLRWKGLTFQLIQFVKGGFVHSFVCSSDSFPEVGQRFFDSIREVPVK